MIPLLCACYTLRNNIINDCHAVLSSDLLLLKLPLGVCVRMNFSKHKSEAIINTTIHYNK